MDSDGSVEVDKRSSHVSIFSPVVTRHITAINVINEASVKLQTGHLELQTRPIMTFYQEF